MRNFEELFAEFECEKLNNEFVKENVQNIINQHYNENNNVEVYKQCLNQIDLTTLNGDDTCAKVETMVEKVNNFKSNFSTQGQLSLFLFLFSLYLFLAFL